ncbi:NADPH:adrenodoxin oxidoreductase, mitochondrial [Orchesella cincta]|uniref:NADPH:adrenodoxin oxidoreductase, mitochondrial n=1 Tax=Orchesella cincta TaxID=48709 RepID=A0A1D2MK77_ORCCI|nr:NADPH:adrenodoxin oxidoreductase, mitochondrial [Orchesella cincta]
MGAFTRQLGCIKRVIHQSQVRYSSTHHHVCVIGSGPAGFYAAQHLLKLRAAAQKPLQLDMFEKLPVPFGLVRYGVAPDHPEVKNVINTFTSVLKNKSVRFVGNIQAGQHVTLQQLVNAYHAIILCYGATSDRLLNIPNENLITSAREFVGWYNGLPANANLPVSLKSCNTALIIGHGNVALDIARILLTNESSLQGTDIAEYALKELKNSGVKQVLIVGRRGVLQVAFTIKEFREMVKLPNVGWDIQTEETVSDATLEALPRARKRLTSLILDSCKTNQAASPEKSWTLKFLRSPEKVERVGDKIHVTFRINKMEGEKAVPTDKLETIPCDIAFRSIGYKGTKLFHDLPFDEATGVIPNNHGKVVDGIYTCGWAGQGPRGVILSTMQNAFDVAKTVSHDLDGSEGSSVKQGFESLNISHRVTHYDDYVKIAEFESKTGNKLTSIDEMMRVCNSV